MLNLNKETYAGRIIYKKNIGKKVAGTYFVLACNSSYRDQNGKFHVNTNDIQLTAWRYLSKRLNDYGVGDNVYVEAHTVTQQYQDNKGNTRNVDRHITDKINLIQRSRKNQAQVHQQSQSTAPSNPSTKPASSNNKADNKSHDVNVDDSDLPF